MARRWRCRRHGISPPYLILVPAVLPSVAGRWCVESGVFPDLVLRVWFFVCMSVSVALSSGADGVVVHLAPPAPVPTGEGWPASALYGSLRGLFPPATSACMGRSLGNLWCFPLWSGDLGRTLWAPESSSPHRRLSDRYNNVVMALVVIRRSTGGTELCSWHAAGVCRWKKASEPTTTWMFFHFL